MKASLRAPQRERARAFSSSRRGWARRLEKRGAPRSIKKPREHKKRTDTAMNERFAQLGQRGTRTGLAVLTAILLVTGAAWHGIAADPQSAPAHSAPAVTTPITHAVAGGRDSYADVVNVVAPA